MSLGFTKIIQTQSCIDNLSFDHTVKRILTEFYTNFNKMYGQDWSNVLPLTYRKSSPEFKIRRQVPYKPLIELVKKNPSLSVVPLSSGFKIIQENKQVMKVLSGEGSRNNKAGGGKAGIGFESTLKDALSGKCDNHKSIVGSISDILSKSYDINLSRSTVSHEGVLNKKRNPVFNGTRLTLNGLDIGKTISDLTITEGSKIAYISLKWSSQFYLTNISIRKYLYEGRARENIDERNALVKSLGFAPSKFFEPYGIHSADDTQLDSNILFGYWKSLIQEILGSGYIYVVSGGKYDTIIDLSGPSNVEVISVDEPIYAESGVRKYSKIGMKVLINGKNYNLECQLRGTTATDTLPYYLRLVAR